MNFSIMRNNFNLIFIQSFLILGILLIHKQSSFAQDVLSKQDAISRALENNFGVLIGNNNLALAENNKSILNSRFLPTLGASAGVNYNLNNITANFQNGNITELNGATSNALNAGLNLNYTLFDGLGRWYNYKQLQETYKLSELQARITMENAVFQTLTAYYNVAIQEVIVSTLREAIQVSASRLSRTKIAFDYAQGNKLSVLNAQVDLSNDSISLANARLNLDNAKRNLNAILVQDINQDFVVDTQVTFFDLTQKEALKSKMFENNSSLLEAEQNLLIGSYTQQVARANFLPTIGTSAQYGWNKNNNNEASFLASSVSYGLSAGANLTWNLFDGGTAKTNVQNAKITRENLILNVAQTKNELERDFEIAWADYLNKIYLYKTQEKNLVSNQDNFTRTNEMFKLGQVSSVEFRQAQQNLLMVANQVTQSKFNAKLAEYRILQLTGDLLEANF